MNTTPSKRSSDPLRTVYYSTISKRRVQNFQELPFPQKYNYVYDEHSPDIIGMFNFSYLELKKIRQLLSLRWRHGYQPVLFRTTGEFAAHEKIKGVDFSFSYHPATKQNCQWHYMLVGSVWKALLPGQVRDERREKLRNLAKTRFCCFIYSNDATESTRVRRNFCQLLAQYKRVDCPGRSLNNMPGIPSPGSPGSYQAKLDFAASCKFSIAFERVTDENYLTEKLPDALYAGAVPVYWGCPRAAEYYNPAAFINCHDYKSFADVVQRVIEVDNNPRLYEEYRNAPPILPAARYYGMMEEMEKYCADMLEEVMARLARKTNILYDRALVYWLVLRSLGSLLTDVGRITYYSLYKKSPLLQPLLRRMRRFFVNKTGHTHASL